MYAGRRVVADKTCCLTGLDGLVTRTQQLAGNSVNIAKGGL